MLDIRQTKEYAQYLSRVGWKVERIDGVNYFIKNLPIIGSLLKIQRPEKIDYKAITKLVKQYRIFQIIIEPKANSQKLVEKGFRLSRSPFLPSRTLCVDLAKSKEKLFSKLKKDCRQAINKNRKRKVAEYRNRLKEFREMWAKSVGWKRYVPPLSQLYALKKSFGNKVLFPNAQDSGAIFLVGDKTAYYWQAFTGKSGRKSKIQYKIVWEGIMWAKNKGAKVFDFEGTYDERFPNKSWLGFTHFKRSFGGYEVEYPGAYTKLPFFKK